MIEFGIEKARRLESVADMADELERRLGPAWIDALAWLRGANSIADIARRIEAGDYDGAVANIVDAAARFAADVNAGQIVAAQRGAAWLDGNMPDRLVTFDRTNAAAVQAIATTRTDLIASITEDQRQLVRGVLLLGVERGDNPKVIARDIRGAIGLTQQQAVAVDNFRGELQAQRWGAANARELVDGNIRRTLARLARDGGSLDGDQIERLVGRYRQSWIAFRAETIARTESLRASHGGYSMMFQQGVDNGIVHPNELVQRWNHRAVGRWSRQDHIEMHGQEQEFGIPFVSGSGELLMYPCDPNAPPSETIRCRCCLTIRFARGPRRR